MESTGTPPLFIVDNSDENWEGLRHFRAMAGRLTSTRRGAYFYITSLPTVSTAGRGAALSGAAPAFFRHEEVVA